MPFFRHCRIETGPGVAGTHTNPTRQRGDRLCMASRPGLARLAGASGWYRNGRLKSEKRAGAVRPPGINATDTFFPENPSGISRDPALKLTHMGQGGSKGMASTLGRCDNSAEDSRPGTAPGRGYAGIPPLPPRGLPLPASPPIGEEISKGGDGAQRNPDEDKARTRPTVQHPRLRAGGSSGPRHVLNSIGGGL